MGRILRWGLLQLCQSLVNGLYLATLHICYGKRFYNDFFLNHHTIALVHNCLKLLSCVVIETALDGMKRINYLNSLLSTRKRTI